MIRADRRFTLAALVVGAAALAGLCWRFGLHDLAEALGRVSGPYLLVYFVIGCAVRLGYSLRWRMVARALGQALPLRRLVAARLAGDAVGTLIPAGRVGGDPLRVALLYGKGIGGTQVTAGVAIDRIMELLGNMLCAVAYASVFSLTRALGTGQRPVVLLLLVMGLLLVSLVVPLEMLRRGRRPLSPFYRLAALRPGHRWKVWVDALWRTEGHVMRFLRQHPATFVWGLAMSLAIEGAIIVEYHFLLRAFGLVLAFPTLLMALLASGLARVVPTPAGLGALEASQVAVLSAAAGQPAAGFVTGIVMRLHETLWVGVGLLVLAPRTVSWVRVRTLASADKTAL